MGWKTIVIGAECVVSLTYNRMEITLGNDYQNIPLNDIDTVIFSHDKVTLTIPLLSELIKNNINVVVCDSKNDPIGVFQAFNGHSLAFKQLKKQIDWKVTRKKKLWKKIIQHKILSEYQLLEELELEPLIQHQLKYYANTVQSDDVSNREAASARIYFNVLFGKDFKRDDPLPINFALNYGYKIIASYISKCITSRGLLTQLGIHHIGEGNAFNLTYDFIEPFRVIVDRWVYENVSENFLVSQKIELIKLLQARICVSGKWYRFTDAIEDIIDSYIAFLNESNDQILSVDYKSGIQYAEE